MKVLAIILNLVWITALIMILTTIKDGFEFKNSFYPVLLFSFISIVFLNIKVFKNNQK